MGLASVIQRDIKTVYPDQRSQFLPILQTTVQPRLTSFKCQSSLDVFIMWSNIQGWPDRSKTFCVNHFVPLISLPSHMKSDTESVRSKDRWNIYSCKRKRRGSNLICHSHNDSPDCILLSDSKRRATSQPTTDNRWHVLVEDKETDLRDEYEGEYENMQWKSAEKMKLKPCCEKIGASNKENVGNKQNIHKEESLERIPSARNTDFENIDNPGLRVMNVNVNETSDTSEQEIQYADETANETEEVGRMFTKIYLPTIRSHQNLTVPGEENSIKDTDETADINKEVGCVSTRIPLPRRFPQQNLTTSEKGNCIKDTCETAFTSEQKIIYMSSKLNQPKVSSYLADNELKKRKSLPFPAASQTFYQKQGYLSRHNEKSSELRIKFPVQKNEKGNVGVHRSCTTGTLAKNIRELREQLQGPNSLCYPARAVHLKACIDVAEELIKCTLLKTSDAYRILQSVKITNGKLYKDYYRSVDAYETLAKNLNISQIYIEQTGYIIENNGENIQNIVDHVNGMIQNYSQSAMTNTKSIAEALKADFATVLRYFDTKRDRDMLEAIIARIYHKYQLRC
ncbi:Hypothetical predicted protein [Paramuricea clavata]|uniref:Uncharacterized protein n=1 Tax=Paramuricea clavata TaxID=317549 RepID=A0A7D9JI61_PARCT|nr:Hypothetical predicted protein [Paramuricea clavata]